MSNANVPVVPDYMKKFLNQGQGDVDAAATAAVSIPRISLKGKKFRFIEGGEEVNTVNEHLDCIIMGIEPGPGRFTKTFYVNPYAGAASSGTPPDCASDDGIAPSGWVSKPQATNCAQCPKNAFGSATSMSGKPSKACKDSKRLWIAMPDDPEGTLWGMNITVSSLKALSAYGRDRKESGVPLSLTITRITMLDDNDFPAVAFEVGGYIENEKDAEALIARAEKREWSINRPAALPPAQQTPALSAPSVLPGAAKPVSDATPADVDNLVNNW